MPHPVRITQLLNPRRGSSGGGGSSAVSFTDSITYNGSELTISGTKAGTLHDVSGRLGQYAAPAGATTVNITCIGTGEDGKVDGTGGSGGGQSVVLAESVPSGSDFYIGIGAGGDYYYSSVNSYYPTVNHCRAGAGFGDNSWQSGAGIGDIVTIGGNGGTNGGNSGGGGGGSSGGSADNGNNGQTAVDNTGAAGGEAPGGGYAGAAGGDSGLSGENATGFGSGGGGAGDGGAGGTGAPGLIVISGTYTP